MLKPCLSLVLLVLTAAAPFAAGEPLLGFDDAGAAAQRELEQRFDAQLKAENLRQWMARLAAKPHHVGSPHGKANAQFMAGLFESWGYETRIEEFEVLFPTPKIRLVEMVAPESFTASLEEVPLGEDAGKAPAGESEGALPPYNAYSKGGDVTAELVYVNYGVPDDYEELDRRGIDVEGKIEEQIGVAAQVLRGLAAELDRAAGIAAGNPV